MKNIRVTLVAIAALLLSACQSTSTFVELSPEPFLNDSAFPAALDYELETEEDIFSLDSEAKRYVKETIRGHHTPFNQMRALAQSIFGRSSLDLLYEGSANTGATETFHKGAANCLSMSIMAYALAKEAGFAAYFQDVSIPEYWTRNNGYSLLNGHVNVRLETKDSSRGFNASKNSLQVDFVSMNTAQFDKRGVSKDIVTAMFYNNKGADALLSKNYNQAYAYFRKAVTIAPDFDATYTNLGLLYRISQFYDLAERSYQQAIALDPDNLTAWENLSLLYDHIGQPQQAESIRTRLARKRSNNPYYHYMLGEQEFELGNVDGALTYFRRALSLDRTKHEVYFALAKTYFKLGDTSRAIQYLELAKSHSNSHQEQDRYQGKLELLSKR